MTVLTEGRRAAEFLISEGPGNYSREEVTVAAGTHLKAGEVFEFNNAGEAVVFNNDSDSGAKGVMLAEVDATDGAKKGTAIRRLAEVKKVALIVSGDDSDLAVKDHAIASLAADCNPPIITRE